jgi:hypothetical protein
MEMPYTVWSRGRLLGETELAHRPSLPGLRAGDFSPTEMGERLMPVMTGVGPALCALHELTEELKRRNPRVEVEEGGEWAPVVRRTTEYADAVSVTDELQSLNLELRDSTNVIVRTEWISVQDTQRLVAMAREDMEQAGEDPLDGDVLEPWQPEPPRYQIMVALEGHDREMTRLASKRRR